MRGRVGAEDEARAGADGGAERQRLLLATDEALEVIVDDGFGQGGSAASSRAWSRTAWAARRRASRVTEVLAQCRERPS